MSSDGVFTCIITQADAAQLDVAITEFAKQFSLVLDVAKSILKGAPIVFITGLTKAEVRAITPGMQNVSKLGVEFRLTLMEPNKLPRVNWPVRPQFTAAGSGGPHAVTFSWDNNAFVCPGCGETFMFRRMGKLPLTVDIPVAAPRPTGSSPKLPAVPETPLKRTASQSGLPASTAGIASPAKAEPKKEAALAPAKAEAAADLGGVDLDLGGGIDSLDLGSALEEAAADGDKPAEGKESKGKAAPAAETKPVGDVSLDVDLGEGLLSSEEALKEEPGAEMEAAAAPGEDIYNIFVSQIKDAAKRDEVAKMVVEIRKCSMDEAKQMTGRMMFKAADNVPKPKADVIMAQLKKLKVSARMTKAGAPGS